ncbi:hypothetical protein P872_21610 [Rhodonellum psychrophilum GCM71 = DSM 17998]|uniref:RES domain-containing protein n=2 Tax=Rhodonellum TaxID=336827 RepID=U5BSH6_9BACT|nr:MULTISPECIES: RES family NAD+ phosphorylase [Rhodonellum]ERM80474.1 hypothetical protein P872_21610 [Rhodonellum psychrophilum GCM71 = DSM 17998]SDZ57861.1 RES domain-containing protein [Rhodonellum ikkaensis]
MLVYRIAGSKYAHDLSGMGAALFGGRWNKKGIPVLYTSESQALSLLETVVNTPPMLVPQMELLILKIPDDSIEEIKGDALPKNWFKYPAPTILAEMGSKWAIQKSTLALKVPSSIIPSSFNYLLNCWHPRFSEVELLSREIFHFDPRLKK